MSLPARKFSELPDVLLVLNRFCLRSTTMSWSDSMVMLLAENGLASSLNSPVTKV